MKVKYLLVWALLVICISACSGQKVPTIAEGKTITATLMPGEIHTYRIRLKNKNVYIIEWDDSDTSSYSYYADIKVGLRKDGDSNYLISVSDSGNLGDNKHRVDNIKSNVVSRNADYFVPNSWYIVEVRGYSSSGSGTYTITFY